MTIEDATFIFLSAQPNITAIVPKSRIYRYEIPQSSPYPVITVARVDTVRDLAQDGYTHLADSRMQIGCFSTLNDAESRQIADQVRIACHGFRGSWGSLTVLRARTDTDLGSYDAISQTYQTIIDVMVMFHEQE